MTLTLHDASGWPYEAIDWPNVMASIRKYAARFPDDATPESIVADLVRGALRLWLVRDEAGATVAAVLVSPVTITEATGWKRVSVHGYGGDRGIEALPLLAEIEAWARSQGADELEIVGRTGWRRALAPQGYAEAATLLRKRL